MNFPTASTATTIEGLTTVRADLAQVEPQILSNRQEALPDLPAARPLAPLTVSPTEPVEAGKGGKGGDFQIINAEFITAVFPSLPEGAFAAVCSKLGNPDQGGWPCRRADQVASGLATENNTSAAQVSIPATTVL